MTSSQLPVPRKRIILNLAPAGIPKDGTGFDLAMAAAILRTAHQLPNLPGNTLVLGELSLDGSLRPIPGIIGKILAGLDLGYTDYIIPADNLTQARLVTGTRLFPISNLHDFYLHCSGLHPVTPVTGQFTLPITNARYPDFQEVIGQATAKRALEIAAAGNHNVLLSGPPGTGKSMLAKALPSILPPLSQQEILEVTHLQSLHGAPSNHIASERPFRAPHHSSSPLNMIGGGQRPKPGEISLSHRGVLFLDELPEYRRSTLESLRQPLEDRSVTLTRNGDSYTYPANFMLIATSNPCPCGYFGSTKACSCSAYTVQRYQQRLSGPILDRMDMHVLVDGLDHTKLLLGDNGQESSATIRQRVEAARERQLWRYGPGIANGDLSNKELKRFARLEPAAKKLLERAGQQYGLSARAYLRTVKIGRTVADLAGSDQIKLVHITEALQYKPQTSAER